MKSIGNPKTFRRLHNDAGASSRLESLNINSSLEVAARSHFVFERVASSLPLSLVQDSARCSIMENSGADAASLQVNPFHCQIFLNDLRFDQLYAFVSLFSPKSNFSFNDVGCEIILIGKQEEKDSRAKEAKQRKKKTEKEK